MWAPSVQQFVRESRPLPQQGRLQGELFSVTLTWPRLLQLCRNRSRVLPSGFRMYGLTSCLCDCSDILLVFLDDGLVFCAWSHRPWHVIMSTTRLGCPPAIFWVLGSYDRFCLGYRTLYVNRKQLYIFLIFGVYSIFYVIHVWNIDDASLFIKFANVCLTHSLSFWKCVDIG